MCLGEIKKAQLKSQREILRIRGLISARGRLMKFPRVYRALGEDDASFSLSLSSSRSGPDEACNAK